MKKSLYEFMFGKQNRYSAVFALLVVFLVVMGCGGEKPSGPPTEAEAQSLLKGTISDFAGAIDSGTFNTLKGNASKEFQALPDSQLSTTFKTFTDQKEDVVPILREASTMNPKFTTPPTIREEKGYHILVTNGQFDTSTVPTKFQNEYVFQDGKWKLLKIQVNL